MLHVALQVVDDAKTLLTPFLPSSSTQGARRAGRRRATGRAMPELVEVDEPTAAGSPSLPGAHRRLRHAARAGSRRRSQVGRPLAPPTPMFTKLDPSIVDEELARLDRVTASRCQSAASSRTPLASAAPTPLPADAMVDAHCHLDAMGDEFVADSRWRDARRGRRDPAWSRSATRWRRRGGAWAPRPTHPDVYAAVAVHPTEVGGLDRRRLRRARAELARRPARAWRSARPGWTTTGTAPSRPLQQEQFRAAHRAGQAGRQAADDPRPGRARRRAAHPGARRARRSRVVFHCFSGDAEMASAVRASRLRAVVRRRA